MLVAVVKDEPTQSCLGPIKDLLICVPMTKAVLGAAAVVFDSGLKS